MICMNFAFSEWVFMPFFVIVTAVPASQDIGNTLRFPVLLLNRQTRRIWLHPFPPLASVRLLHPTPPRPHWKGVTSLFWFWNFLIQSTYTQQCTSWVLSNIEYLLAIQYISTIYNIYNFKIHILSKLQRKHNTPITIFKMLTLGW